METDLRRREVHRLGVLRRYEGAAALAAARLERLSRLAAFVSGLPFAAVHLLDDAHQHRVAGRGVPLGPTPVTDSMCALAVHTGGRVTTSDASRDARFAGNPWTTGDAPVRAYSAHPLCAPDGAVLGTLCVFAHAATGLAGERLSLLDALAMEVVDALEMARAARDLAHGATHDALTDLPNRTLLADRLDRALSRREPPGLAPALVLVDLDGFKSVNDRHGHGAGDRLLQEVAARLRGAVRAEDTVARVGGDEFVVLCERVGAPEHLAVMLERLDTALCAPIDAAPGVRVRIGASTGVVVARAGESAEELLARADRAMYDDKARRRAALIPGQRG